MRSPKQPLLNQVVGGLGAIVATAASLEASGIINAVQAVSPKHAPWFALVGSVVAWLARAPIGKR